MRGATPGAFWPVTWALFVLPLTTRRVLLTWARARTRSGVITQLMHFSDTASLALFVPVAQLSPRQPVNFWIERATAPG